MAENKLALLHLSHVIGRVSHAGVRPRQGERGRLRGHLLLFPSFQTCSFRIQIPFCGRGKHRAFRSHPGLLVQGKSCNVSVGLLILSLSFYLPEQEDQLGKCTLLRFICSVASKGRTPWWNCAVTLQSEKVGKANVPSSGYWEDLWKRPKAVSVMRKIPGFSYGRKGSCLIDLDEVETVILKDA